MAPGRWQFTIRTMMVAVAVLAAGLRGMRGLGDALEAASRSTCEQRLKPLSIPLPSSPPG